MQAMKGATGVLGSMNRNMNLPALQRIAMEFEKENDIMDQRQEMMDDAIDDVTGLEDEEEGDEIVDQVLEEIGVDLKNAVSLMPCPFVRSNTDSTFRWAKLHKDYKAPQYQRDELHKLSEEVQLVGEGILEITISKLDLTVLEDEISLCDIVLAFISILRTGVLAI